MAVILAKGRRSRAAVPGPAELAPVVGTSERIGFCRVCRSSTPRLLRLTSAGWTDPVCLEVTW